MYANVRSVFEDLKQRKFIVSFGVVLVACGVFLSTGYAHNELFAAGGPAVMVASQPALPASDVEPLLALDKATEAVAARVMPSVVHVDVIDTGRAASRNGMGMPDQGQDQGNDMQGMPGLPPEFQQFFRQYRGGQQAPQSQPEMKGEGSGVIVSPDGYIVTNNHVTTGAKTINVKLNDGRTFAAKLIGADSATDLAVIKITASGLTSAPWGDSSQLKPGQSVMAFGNPLGEDFTVTRGIVSALNRPRNLGDDPNARGEFIQTDAAINEGNSGGPLVNARGEVIGIDAEMLTNGGGYAGIGFAIPSNLVEPTAESLIKNGKIVRGYLGISVLDLNPDLAQGLDLASNANGALVDTVDAGGPAAEAGLHRYDVITSVNGKTIANGNDLQAAVGALAPGTPVHVAVMRDGHPQTITATLGSLNAEGKVVPNGSADASPEGNAGSAGGNRPASTASIGASVSALTPDMRSQLRLGNDVNGVVVQSVVPGSPADQAGIASGDVIEQVNKKPVDSPDALQQQLAASAGSTRAVLLLVHNQGGDFIIAVHPATGGGQ